MSSEFHFGYVMLAMAASCAHQAERETIDVPLESAAPAIELSQPREIADPSAPPKPIESKNMQSPDNPFYKREDVPDHTRDKSVPNYPNGYNPNTAKPWNQ